MRERIHAPELTGASAWLNTDRPLTLRELRGQVVVLDFWTYCCVNCMHVLPILRDLEERHAGDPLVVIGIHSAKFDAEKDQARILAAMGRYGVSHPVAVDSEMRIWSAYAVRSWPTLIVVRPDGTLAAVAPGEPEPAVLEAFVQRELEEARAAGKLARDPLRLAHREAEPQGPLLYPGKIARGGERLFVADSGHHRVLVLDGNGAVVDCVGSGLRGFREGAFEECALDDPQGLAWNDGILYVADARAHIVAAADFAKRELRREAGTRELGRAPLLEKTPALDAALRSPWDLALRGTELYVALAGSHQIGLIRLDQGTVEPVVGNGREAQLDGQGTDAALAQPSGLSLQGDVLYIADSESSGVRALHLRTRKLYSLAGGPGLFDFGDRTGRIEPGMLQHPLAVAATAAAGLLVADTYNDRIKRFSPDGLRLDPFHQGGLAQPAGLCVLADGEVLVADTNHHRIVRLSAEGAFLGELPVSGAPQPRSGVAVERADPPPANGAGWFTALVEPSAGLGPGEGTLSFEISAPEQFELSEGAPWSVALEVSRRSDLLRVTPELVKGETRGGPRQVVQVRATCSHAGTVESELIVTLRAVVCDARDHASCWPAQNSFRVPLRLLAEGQSEVRVVLPVEISR